jgi:hypothetical protein
LSMTSLMGLSLMNAISCCRSPTSLLHDSNVSCGNEL